ncbi:hypothetical protein J2T13_000199 [Paenibacillus sp. DS2015]
MTHQSILATTIFRSNRGDALTERKYNGGVEMSVATLERPQTQTGGNGNKPPVTVLIALGT